MREFITSRSAQQEMIKQKKMIWVERVMTAMELRPAERNKELQKC